MRKAGRWPGISITRSRAFRSSATFKNDFRRIWLFDERRAVHLSSELVSAALLAQRSL